MKTPITVVSVGWSLGCHHAVAEVSNSCIIPRSQLGTSVRSWLLTPELVHCGMHISMPRLGGHFISQVTRERAPNFSLKCYALAIRKTLCTMCKHSGLSECCQEINENFFYKHRNNFAQRSSNRPLNVSKAESPGTH